MPAGVDGAGHLQETVLALGSQALRAGLSQRFSHRVGTQDVAAVVQGVFRQIRIHFLKYCGEFKDTVQVHLKHRQGLVVNLYPRE